MPRFASIPGTARHLDSSEKTVENYIGRGLFPVYKRRGERGWLVDLDEVDAALAKLPRSKARAGKPPFGPNTKVVELPPLAEVITAAGEAQ